MRCVTCSRQLEERVENRAEARSGGVTAVIHRFPILACPENHSKRYRYPDLGHDLIAQLHDSIPRIVVDWRRNKRCSECAAEISGEPQHRLFRVGVQPRVGDPFEVEVTQSGITCSRCGSSQAMDGDLGVELSDALIVALDGADIEPG